jgi:hypothetical protein
MPVYIDNAFLPFQHMRMCHLLADSREELDAMADKIGVPRKWIQFPDTPEEHYDICASKRLLAIRSGAIAIDMMEMAAYRRKRLQRVTQ